jgi:hypothetical protein
LFDAAAEHHAAGSGLQQGVAAAKRGAFQRPFGRRRAQGRLRRRAGVGVFRIDRRAPIAQRQDGADAQHPLPGLVIEPVADVGVRGGENIDLLARTKGVVQRRLRRQTPPPQRAVQAVVRRQAAGDQRTLALQDNVGAAGLGAAFQRPAQRQTGHVAGDQQRLFDLSQGEMTPALQPAHPGRDSRLNPGRQARDVDPLDEAVGDHDPQSPVVTQLLRRHRDAGQDVSGAGMGGLDIRGGCIDLS